MAELIHIEVTSAVEGIDLVKALLVRGLPTVLVEDDYGVELELDVRSETTDHLLLELFPALRAWADDRRRGPLLVRVGQTAYTVGARHAVAA